MFALHQGEFRDAFAPAGLFIDHVELIADQILITGRSRSPSSICPRCPRPSARVHNHYRRTLADLPSHGRSIRIELSARRFRCAAPNCLTRIFVERLSDELAARFARRTTRLERIVHHLGLALGSRPASGRSVAPDGKREPGLSRRCAQINARDSPGAGRRRDRSGTSHLRRAASV